MPLPKSFTSAIVEAWGLGLGLQEAAHWCPVWDEDV